jgi:LysM repeat protein
VSPGDTVHGLAERHGVSAETIIWANDLADADIIGVDETLEIPPVSGVLHRVRPGDTVAELVSFYGGAFREVLDINRLAEPFIIVVGQPLMIPGGKVPPPVSPGETTEVEPALPPLPIPPAATDDQRAFILGHARAAQRSQKATGIPSSVTLAQAILETYWGTSRLSREAHNYFGIKARETPGPAGVITFNVWEHVNGRDIFSNEPFRRYNNAEESFVDHGQWFHTWPRYAGALAVKTDPKAFARAINQAGYATDPAYSAKLISLMDKFNLYAYD